MRLAIPVFRARVSPVFDSADRVMVFHIENRSVTQRSLVWLPPASLVERAGTLERAGINVLICASIGRPLRTILAESGIRVIHGVVGDVEEVLSGFMEDGLHHPRFVMPGCQRRTRQRRCRRGFDGMGGQRRD